MSNPELPILNASRLEELDRRVRGSPGLRALESAATVIGLGTLFFIGAVGYNILSDVSNKVTESIEDATTGINVSAVVFSDEGFRVLKAWQLSKRFGYVRFLEFNTDYQRARGEFENTGTVKALPGTAARVKAWEDAIVRLAPELLSEGEKLARVNPFDNAIGTLLNNRGTFFAAVGAVALVPVVPVLGDIFREGLRRSEQV